MFALYLALRKQFRLNALVDERAGQLPVCACRDNARTPSQLHELSHAPSATLPKRPLEFRPYFPDYQSTSSHDFGVSRLDARKLRKDTGAFTPSSGAMTATTTTRGWTSEGLVALGPRMQHVPRVSAIKDSDRLDAIIKEYEASGTPLIVEDWEKTPQWPGDQLFGVDWLLEHGDESMREFASSLLRSNNNPLLVIAVRDCVTLRDKEVPFKEFIEKSRAISEYAEEDGRSIYMHAS